MKDQREEGKQGKQADTHTPQVREGDPLDDSEILDKPAALAQAKERLGVPADFAGMVYEAWKANGGCNGNRIPIPWLRQVNKRWQTNESVQWRAGTHSEQKKPSGSGHRPRAEPERDTTPLPVDAAVWRAFVASPKYPEYRTLADRPAPKSEAEIDRHVVDDWKIFKRSNPKPNNQLQTPEGSSGRPG